MEVTVKRKRGRPRLNEPREIKDFDNNLIQEFQNYPVFYDREHPQHRNREYTDRIWQRIAQNLNVSTNLAKTRMLQLRNRFNLEKRRVEAMKKHNTSASHWSLYERLAFLSSYVKTRRPYSTPMSNRPKTTSSATSSDGGDEDYVQGSKIQESAFNSNQILSNGSLNSRANVLGLSENQNHLPIDNINPQVQRNIFQGIEQKEFDGKYKAFGQFLASSLIEMTEIQALNLVEKFTIDLVKHLKSEERKKGINASQRSNTDGDDENSSTVY